MVVWRLTFHGDLGIAYDAIKWVHRFTEIRLRQVKWLVQIALFDSFVAGCIMESGGISYFAITSKQTGRGVPVYTVFIKCVYHCRVGKFCTILSYDGSRQRRLFISYTINFPLIYVRQKNLQHFLPHSVVVYYCKNKFWRFVGELKNKGGRNIGREGREEEEDE